MCACEIETKEIIYKQIIITPKYDWHMYWCGWNQTLFEKYFAKK